MQKLTCCGHFLFMIKIRSAKFNKANFNTPYYNCKILKAL